MSTEASGMLVKTLMEKPTSTENKTKNGDEQIQGMSLTVSNESPKLADPAIIVVKESHTIKYTRDELLKLRDVPLSRVKPDFSYISEIAPSILHNHSDTANENGPRSGDTSDHRRRPGDPRERIRKEDGIVLSPQRRSFNSGCFVPVREPARTNRSHSPLGKSEAPHSSVREIQTGNRRIGSGRILRDNWDFSEKTESDEYPYRGSGRGNERDEKFGDKRSFGRDFEINRDKDKERRNTRYSDRRRVSNESREEEPEWFSGGPISQNDTIELRGFDEPEKTNKKKTALPKTKKMQESSAKKKESQNSIDEKDEDEAASETTNVSSTNQQTGTEGSNNRDSVKSSENKGSGDAEEKTSQAVEDHPFNFDDFLKCDTIPGLLTNGVGGDGDNAKSRFSAWFKRESPEKQHNVESRRSSLQEEHIIKNLLTDFTEPSVSIPNDSDLYFAPISPAANTGNNINNIGPQAGSKVLNFMEMLHRNKQQIQTPLVGDVPPMIKRSQLPEKILSLDELESRIRQNVEQQTVKQTQSNQTKREEDLTAFNRLLAQVSGGHAITANGPIRTQANTSMTLLEMLSHSQQQDEARMTQAAHLLGGPTSPNASLGATHIPNDMALKLQQIQNQVHHRQQFELLNKFTNMNSTNMHHQQLRTSPLQDMGVQQSRELLMRPEAQAILQGLTRGDITPQHIYQQLANPALQPRHREMLHAIIKLQSQKGGMGPSPRDLSPVPPLHHMYSQHQQQQQQLRVSPHPSNSMHQRIPSPRELQVHTQNILQRALIKKKLEEQQENYRKKQEMQQRGQSPNNNVNNNNTQTTKSQASPTPLTFTPTSVLRKMTAEKDDSKEGNKSILDGIKAPQGRPVTGIRQQNQGQTQPQWNAQFPMKQPVGRPIVKANSNFQSASQPEQFFTQQQQQRLLSQQQQQQSSSQQQQQQQRKGLKQAQQPPYHPGATNPMSHMSYPSSSNQQFSQQLTQQQLRAQHQQHALPSSAPPQQPPAHPSMHPHNYHPANQQQSNWQQFLNTQNSRVNQAGRGGMADGDLSPTTTNQLARWFSPDLLERARGSELPSTAGLAQHVLSLEEIERQTAPPVHN